jgi:hypothetical protein
MVGNVLEVDGDVLRVEDEAVTHSEVRVEAAPFSSYGRHAQ